MKNREEYMASIYSKKNALLAKRKKNIRIAVSAVCIAICFCSAAVVMPKAISKSDSNNTTTATTAPSTTQANVTKIIYNVYEEANEAYLDDASYVAQTKATAEEYTYGVERESKPATTKTAINYYFTAKNEMFDSAASVSKSETNLEEMPDSIEGEKDYPMEEQKPAQTASPYSDEEIAKKAYSHLSDEEKKTCKNVEPFITVTHIKNGQYYTVYYSTDKLTVAVELDCNSLELIDKETKTNNNSTTAKPPYNPTITTPAYDPNKQ